MIAIRMTTDDLPQGDRFAWWYDKGAAALIPSTMASEHADNFQATMNIVPLGSVQILSTTYPSLGTRRTPRLIRQNDPDYLQLSLTLRGTAGLSQADRQVKTSPGDLTLFDSSRPYRTWSQAQGTSAAVVLAQIPKALMPVPADLTDQLTARCIPGNTGFGALLFQFLTHLTASAHEFRHQDALRLSTALVDLFAGAVAQRLDVPLPPENHRHALFLRVQGFIHQHLGEPQLTPERVAAAHHISTRSLHYLFETQSSTTVASFIRQQRLERTRHDLADPLLRARPIHAIAVRWGFARPADFSRAFRSAYGISPRSYRGLVFQGQASPERYAQS